ncbi:hypothetical protein [Haloferax marinisediminis]|uniref:hypothetical protein n=1 Tax=Haloferax marinisediminis TaxID=2666142 RepID=UPI0018A242FB|nr:hypothetical protein [Haloferax marinisediminis]
MFIDHKEIPPLVRVIMTAIHAHGQRIRESDSVGTPPVSFDEWVTSEDIHELLTDHNIHDAYRKDVKELSQNPLAISRKLVEYPGVKHFDIDNSGRKTRSNSGTRTGKVRNYI